MAILIVGAHNAGKTSLFNHLTGSRSKVVNYPGSTVGIDVGRWGDQVVIDTPGVVSLNPHSEDERITVQCLSDIAALNCGATTIDHVICVVDSTQLARQLVVYKQLELSGFNPILVTTMADARAAKETTLDAVVLNARTGEGISNLNAKLTTSPSKDATVSRFNESQLAEQFKWASDQIDATPTEASFDFDRWLLHPIIGMAIFLVIMTMLFWSVFSLVSPMMDAIESSFGFLSGVVTTLMPASLLRDVLTEGVFNSIAGVVVFVPQIWVLFALIGLLEASGYLARGAVLIDRPLAALGLNGRAFVPLLSGCACAVPAMMAARTISNKRERLLTLLAIPLMSCSARLPVYGLLISLMLVQKSTFIGGLMMTGIYVTSLVIAGLVTKVLDWSLPAASSSSFYIELPQWRRPQFAQILRQATTQTMAFIKGAGPIIFVVGIGLWILSTYPNSDASYAQIIGQWLNPIWDTMGVDWRVGFALILSFAAREVFVSALAVIFAIDAESPYLLQTLSNATLESGEPLFTVPTLIELILFFMISMQCMSTVAVAKKEMGNWGWPIAMTVGYIAMGYLAAVAVTALA